MVSRYGAPTQFRGIQKLRRGLYKIRIRVKDPNGILRIKERQVEAASVHDAHRTQLAWKEELKNVTTEGERVEQFLKRWFDQKQARKELAPATIDRYSIAINKHFVPAFGRLPLDAFTTAEIDRWIGACRKKGLKAQTVNGMLNILSTICSSLNPNPMTGVRRVKINDARIKPADPNSLTKEELRIFLEKAKALYRQHYGLILVLFFTGIRKGSALVLKWSDLDEHGVLTIQRRLSGDVILDGTKTGKVQRIPLLPEIVSVLMDYKKRLNRFELVNDYMFPSANGGIHTKTILKVPFLRIAQAAGIKKRITPHGARRTITDLLRPAGAVVTKSITGHVTDGMLYHYSTVETREQKEAIEQAMRGVVNQKTAAK